MSPLTTKTTSIPEVLLAAATAPTPAEEFVMPCGISQQRFWVVDQLVAGNSALNIPLALELKGPLDVEALHKALQSVIMRHESLRTSFAWIDDEVKQIISPQVRFHFQQKDLTSVPVELREECLQQEMVAEAVRPLTLTKAPILRAKLLHLDLEHHALMITLHHIICDGWSNGVIVRDLGLFYDAILKGENARVPELPIQYADYVMWQREWLETAEFREQMAYWEKQLRGNLRALDFPTDHPRRVGRMFPSTIESLLLTEALTTEIKRKCHELGMTIFMIFFAAYVVLLHRYSGQARFMVSTTAANRTRPELENIVGQFANPMLLACDLRENPSFRELLQRVHRQMLDAVSRQEVPFESLTEKLENDTGEKPVIQAHFLFQKAFMQPGRYGQLDLKPLRSVSPGTTFELMFGIVERAEGARLQMEYNSALFEKATIDRMLQHFRILLEGAMESLDMPVGEMPLLTEEERGLGWSSAPIKVEGATHGNAQTVIEKLREQVAAHFARAEWPQAAPAEVPPGALLVVLDQNLRLLPFGVPGDVYLGGLSPESYGERSLVTGPVDCPWPVPLLRTGFLGRMRDDGKVELMGEAEDFVKIGGFRTNLLQIKSLLARHPEVHEVTVAMIPQADGGEQLIAYIVPKAGTSPVEKDLRELLRRKVNDLAQPVQFVPLSSLPKDAKGNVVPELLPPPMPPMMVNSDKMPLDAILYQQLIDIWTEILKIPNVTVEDNFFALGGTSLMALRMMLQVEKLCGRALPLSLLLTGATIANLARQIVETAADSKLTLIPVQPKGTRAPIFFLHGDWAGGGFYTNRLSNLLGEDQPFYLLPPYRSSQPHIMTLEEMAAFHVEAMQEHTPHGPYVIGGYCVGATLAGEMARQLTAKGEKVSHLLLIDPPLWGTPWFRWAWPCVDRLGDVLRWNLQGKIYYFDRVCVSFSRWLKRSPRAKLTTAFRRMGINLPEAPNPLGGSAPQESGDMEILNSMEYAVYIMAYRLYRPQPWLVPTTLFFPESTPVGRLGEVRRNSQAAPLKFGVAVLPGDHHTCITKHTPDLVEAIHKALDGE
jgi:acyl-CoA synthetase (AMP-forming)/AMP-acid ligase II/pimeloyl-ACP methyl ester carboxylesterase